MKLRPEQLPHYLQQQEPPRVCLVSGNETLLVQECCESVRQTLRQLGYDEREVYHADSGFDWSRILVSAADLSLFGTRKILEVRVPGKLPEAGRHTLLQYLQQSFSDALLLLIMPKLDKASQKSKWYKAIDSAGAVVQIWPVDARRMPQWISGRLQAAGLQATPTALHMLCERVEGNLLAAVQEVEKFRLLADTDCIDEALISQAVSDNARFDLFRLLDHALEGACAQVMRIINGLRSEGAEPVLVLWGVARELRILSQLAATLRLKQSTESLFKAERIWGPRRQLFHQAVGRHTEQDFREMLIRASCTDLMIKGLEPGNVWDELTDLLLALAGVAFNKKVKIL
jgi:DNA polymerase-3 subunit delta